MCRAGRLLINGVCPVRSTCGYTHLDRVHLHLQRNVGLQLRLQEVHDAPPPMSIIHSNVSLSLLPVEVRGYAMHVFH